MPVNSPDYGLGRFLSLNTKKWMLSKTARTYLASNIFLGKKILALIVEDHMNFLGTRATDIGT